ncbi:MAG: thioredoxin family protein [Flavobacteriales bacterium]|nr:thioredoxin family protein [Flavobacteriales bacterium]
MKELKGAAPAMLLEAAETAMGYGAYRQLLATLVAQGRTVGPDQSDEMVAYTKLNLARTSRVEKTVKPAPETLKVLKAAPAMTWLVITEPWCGDSSQVLPVLHLMAEAAPRITLRILLRDENLELMDLYLTGGSRGIPKLIAFDAEGRELFTYGPRPARAQEIVMDNKALPVNKQLVKEDLYAKVHAWYAADKGQAVQREIVSLLK